MNLLQACSIIFHLTKETCQKTTGMREHTSLVTRRQC